MRKPAQAEGAGGFVIPCKGRRREMRLLSAGSRGLAAVKIATENDGEKANEALRVIHRSRNGIAATHQSEMPHPSLQKARNKEAATYISLSRGVGG
jgi:hypothetical protein